jgi:Domain of unknown function (DUF1704)
MKRRKQINNSVDAELFLRLREIAPPLLLSSYKIENSTLDELYNKFLVDRQNPEFEFTLPAEKELEDCREKLYRLRDEIIHNKTDKSIESQYILKVEQYIQTIKILLSSKRREWELFETANRERFGELNGDDARGLVLLRMKKYGIFKGVEFDESAVSYAKRVSHRLEGLKEFFEPTPFTSIDLSHTYTAQEVVDFWSTGLRQQYPDWSCVLSENAQFVRTHNRKQQVIVPSSALFTGRKIIGLFAHEIGVHVRRREEGKGSRLQLLSIGMVGSEVAEEGLASMAEQAVGARNRLGGTDRYIALALATGAVDGKKRDFKDIYAVLEEYFFMRYHTQFDTDKALRLSQKGAWKLAVKIFRGGNPSIPGCCMRKEKIYREGSLAMWGVYEHMPDIFLLWSRGKFDLTNQTQVDLVRRYTK